MVNKCLLDEKLKERENAAVLNEIEDYRQFVKYFVKLIEDILNYDELSSYFEEDKTEAEIKIFNKQYNMVYSVMNAYMSVYIKLHREDNEHPKLKVVELKINDIFDAYRINIDRFIYSFWEDEKIITNYSQNAKSGSNMFEKFKYNWSINKDKTFKRFIKDTKYTPSEYIIGCINSYFYTDIIKPKCKMMTYDEFLNSEFKLEVDKKTQKIFDKYFFENIPNIKKENKI